MPYAFDCTFWTAESADVDKEAEDIMEGGIVFEDPVEGCVECRGKARLWMLVDSIVLGGAGGVSWYAGHPWISEP